MKREQPVAGEHEDIHEPRLPRSKPIWIIIQHRLETPFGFIYGGSPIGTFDALAIQATEAVVKVKEVSRHAIFGPKTTAIVNAKLPPI